jgi:hypothetical protein
MLLKTRPPVSVAVTYRPVYPDVHVVETMCSVDKSGANPTLSTFKAFGGYVWDIQTNTRTRDKPEVAITVHLKKFGRFSYRVGSLRHITITRQFLQINVTEPHAEIFGPIID